DVEQDEYALNGVVDDVVERLRMVVEGGDGGRDHHAHPGQLQHVLEVDLAEGRLAHGEDEPAALLEDHVRGAVNEVVRVAVGDGRQRFHAAWDHHHAQGHERPAGERR